MANLIFAWSKKDMLWLFIATLFILPTLLFYGYHLQVIGISSFCG